MTACIHSTMHTLGTSHVSSHTQIRNRKASCVSRLKKKVAHCELQGRLEQQALYIAALQGAVEVGSAICVSCPSMYQSITN